jgi:hypothetical protein
MNERLLKTGSTGKALGLKLVRHLESILAQDGLSPEVAYRLGKIIQGLSPLMDRIFLKTQKGQELLEECLEKTAALECHLQVPDHNLYLLLTNLEKTYEDLLQKIYEFRVKAG